MKVKVLKPLDSWSMIIDSHSLEAAELTAAYAKIERLQRFENTVLNRTHTRRYTLAGVESMENQIESLISVCVEHNSTIIDLQQKNKWLREHHKEAIELLEAAENYAWHHLSCKNCGNYICAKQTAMMRECLGGGGNWKWIFADRYEALKVLEVET